MLENWNDPDALYKAAIACNEQGQHEEALALLERTATHPSYLARARARQATILRQLQRPKESFPMALQAINADMSLVEGWECAASLLIGNKKWPEAKNLLALAVNAIPDDATLNAYHSLALGKDGEPSQAYIYAQKALRLDPNLTPAVLALIEAFCELGYYDKALQDTVQLQSGSAPDAAAFSYGSLAFMNGQYAPGLKAMTSIINSGWRGGDIPEWNGEPTNKRVIFYGGQGYGDMLQFARYIGPLSQRTLNACLHLPRNLTRLIGDSFSHLPLSIHEDDAKNINIPMPTRTTIGIPRDIELRSSLPSLATFTAGGFDAMSASVPYLHASMDLRAEWRKRLAHIPRPWIGMVWAPGTWFNSNPSRTISYDILKPLVDLARAHLISLQLGSEAEKAAQDNLFNAAPFITDFADSAALASELDLLITFDSAPAHLAGAVGTPVWTMLHYNGDWRWLIGREDSIWYPSMRLFRQNQPQNWAGVVDPITDDLRRLLQGDRSVLQPRAWEGPTPVRSPYALPLPQ